MKKDYEKSSGNVFADLGFPDSEQELVKAKLTVQIYRLLKDRDLTHAEAAKLLDASQAQVSALMRCRPVSVSVGRLMEFLTTLGQDVEVTVRPAACSKRQHGLMSVNVHQVWWMADEIEAAKKYEADQASKATPSPKIEKETIAEHRHGFTEHPDGVGKTSPPASQTDQIIVPKSKTFIGTAEVNAATAKMRLVQIADEIISILAGDSQATVKVSVEITADFPEGVSDQIKRAISENATTLGFKNKTWE